MSVEPSHQELWEDWCRTSEAYEKCRCELCRAGSPHECPLYGEFQAAKDAYIDAKEGSL
jgi:hypothetical protein